MTRIVHREVDCSKLELSCSGSYPIESFTLNPIEPSVLLPESIRSLSLVNGKEPKAVATPRVRLFEES
jgi:hypothetical protein